jgi:hypothetical protein
MPEKFANYCTLTPPSLIILVFSSDYDSSQQPILVRCISIRAFRNIYLGQIELEVLELFVNYCKVCVALLTLVAC